MRVINAILNTTLFKKKLNKSVSDVLSEKFGMYTSITIDNMRTEIIDGKVKIACDVSATLIEDELIDKIKNL